MKILNCYVYLVVSKQDISEKIKLVKQGRLRRARRKKEIIPPEAPKTEK